MKKKILAILIGALLLVSMIPVGSMAAKTVALAPKEGNGDYFLKFERTVSNANPTILYFSFVPEAGVTYKVSYDIFTAPGFSSTFAVGYFKSLSQESTHISGTISTVKAATDGWVTKEFEFTGTEDAAAQTSTVFKIGFLKSTAVGVAYVDNMKLYNTAAPEVNLLENAGFEDEFATASVTVTGADPTPTVSIPASSYAFYKGGNSAVLNGALTRISSDEVIAPDVVSVMDASVDGTFTGYAGQSIPAAMSGNSRIVAGTEYDFIAEPGNETNTVLRVNSNNTRAVVKFPVAANAYTDEDVMKISFRVKMLAEYDGETRAEYPINQLIFRLASSAGTTNAYYVRPGIPFDATTENKWLNVEIYVRAINPTTHSLGIDTTAVSGTAGFKYYIDDINVEAVADTHISSLNAMGTTVASKALTGDASTAWAAVYYGEEKASFAKTDVIAPVISYIPAATTDSAFALAAVYKTTGDAQTLVGINVASLTKAAASGVIAGDASIRAQIGVLPVDFSINLSTLSLDEGTYTVEYMVWDTTGFAPIANKTFTIAD